MSEIIKEAIRAYHRMIDIVENDQRNRAANLITPSEIVNTEPNQEQAQTPQTTKVCSVIEISDSDSEDQKVRPIQNRSKSMSVVERKKRQLCQLEENKREKGEEQPSELCHHNVKKRRVEASKSKNNPRRAVRSSKEKKVCNDRDKEMSLIQKRAKPMIVKRKKKHPEENVQESNESSNKSSQINDDHNRENAIIVKNERLEGVNIGLNSSKPMNFQLFEFKNHPRVAFQNAQRQMASYNQTIEYDDLEFDLAFDLIETGRLIRGRPYVNNDILRLIYTLMRRFSKFEKPNGGSFYCLRRGMYVQGNGDCLQKVNCYGHQKHSCPVLLTIDYKHDDSVYKLYKSGTHNHGLNHVETKKSKKRDIFEDIETEIISSKIAD